MQLYFDESGNTGIDLLNPEQPIFALASTNLGRQVCEELIGPLLQQKQVEAKYSKLKGTRQGQDALLSFANSPLLTEESCVFMQADKRYYLLTHLVDKLIEPVANERGLDLYAGDAHVSLTNLFYYTGRVAFPDGHWMRIQKALLQALRQLSPDSFARFEAVVSQALPHVPESFSMLGTMLWSCIGRMERSLGVYRGMTVFDPAVDVFINVVNVWMKRHAGYLQITHDQSKPLRRSEKLLRSMMTNVPSRMIGYGLRKAELPIRVSELSFGDSRSLPQLQVADILAGLTIDCTLGWSGMRTPNSFHEAMKQSPIALWSVQGMMPSLTMGRSNDPEPGEVSLVDGSGAFLKEVGFL